MGLALFGDYGSDYTAIWGSNGVDNLAGLDVHKVIASIDLITQFDMPEINLALCHFHAPFGHIDRLDL